MKLLQERDLRMEGSFGSSPTAEDDDKYIYIYIVFHI